MNKRLDLDTGLCNRCSLSSVTRNARGSMFLLCLHSEADPGYPRYPRLPILHCDAYTPKSQEQSDKDRGKLP